jgi:hypothetical protein
MSPSLPLALSADQIEWAMVGLGFMLIVWLMLRGLL